MSCVRLNEIIMIFDHYSIHATLPPLSFLFAYQVCFKSIISFQIIGASN
jgi:hypothetical protein